MRSNLRSCARSFALSQRWSAATVSTPRLQLQSINVTRARSEVADKRTHDFDGYSTDLLNVPLHRLKNAQVSSTPEPTPSGSPLTTKDETLAKARIVFGSKLAGPAERKREIARQSQMVAGVLVPPRPEEPDNCCMSGCVNCVWDTYRDELEEWAAQSAAARRSLAVQNRNGQEAGSAARPTGSEDKDLGGLETSRASGTGEEQSSTADVPDLFADIPVGIREFMKTEKRLKAQQKRASATIR